MCMSVQLLKFRLFVTPWTIACQAPLPLGFSRQEYWSGNIYTNICKIDSQGKLAVRLRELKPGLCDNLEGWEGGWVGGREAHEVGDICILMADSCCCRAETNTTL